METKRSPEPPARGFHWLTLSSVIFGPTVLICTIHTIMSQTAKCIAAKLGQNVNKHYFCVYCVIFSLEKVQFIVLNEALLS